MNFEIHRSKDEGFYFRIVARNGNVLATSETYTTKQSVQKTIKSMFRQLEGARVKDLT